MNIARREFIKTSGISVSFLMLPGILQKFISNLNNRPNIIVFLVDDLGWQDTSEPFYKNRTDFNDRYHTPNIEKMALEGMKFTQAYAYTVCSPSRVSLMTGMNAARHRVTNWTLYKNKITDDENEILQYPEWNMNGISPDPNVEHTILATTLPMILRDVGYKTIHCGKSHLGAYDTPGANPLNLGFDINIAGHSAGAPGSYDGRKNFGNKSINEHTLPWGVPGLNEYYGKDISLTEALTLESIKAMDKSIKEDKPFFLYMAHYAVHIPLEPDKRFIEKYLRMGLDGKEAAYASMVEATDKSLGDIMNFIEKKQINNNTIILFMSDNGGLSAVGRVGQPHTHNKPLSSGKGSAHEGGIREPMIVKWPGKVKPASVCEQYIIIEDFFPTILEMARIKNYKAVQHIDGLSFIPLLNQTESNSQNRCLFWHYPNNWGPKGPGIGASSSIRKGDWKLIYYHADSSFELFNIAEDIGELNNLYEKDNDKVKELADELTDYLKKSEAQMPVLKETGKTVDFPIDALLKKQK